MQKTPPKLKTNDLVREEVVKYINSVTREFRDDIPTPKEEDDVQDVQDDNLFFQRQ